MLKRDSPFLTSELGLKHVITRYDFGKFKGFLCPVRKTTNTIILLYNT